MASLLPGLLCAWVAPGFCSSFQSPRDARLPLALVSTLTCLLSPIQILLTHKRFPAPPMGPSLSRIHLYSRVYVHKQKVVAV